MDKLQLFIKTIEIELLKIETNVIFLSLYKYSILLLLTVHVNDKYHKIGYMSYNFGSSENETALILSKFD